LASLVQRALTGRRPSRRCEKLAPTATDRAAKLTHHHMPQYVDVIIQPRGAA
jgi:hypothetical protein